MYQSLSDILLLCRLNSRDIALLFDIRDSVQQMEWPVRTLSYSRPRRSCLLELPAEIREAIFEFALMSEKPLVTFRLDAYQRDDYQEASQPALTRVNRQIRLESLPVFYNSNNINLSTEEPKATDTQRWLECIEVHLPRLLAVSFWIRYVALPDARTEASGAICISLSRSRADIVWIVHEEWRWLTPTRKPNGVEMDAEFLLQETNKILYESPYCLDCAEGFVAAMTDLKAVYTRTKKALFY